MAGRDRPIRAALVLHHDCVTAFASMEAKDPRHFKQMKHSLRPNVQSSLATTRAHNAMADADAELLSWLAKAAPEDTLEPELPIIDPCAAPPSFFWAPLPDGWSRIWPPWLIVVYS